MRDKNSGYLKILLFLTILLSSTGWAGQRVTEVKHSIWATPGSLVEMRLPAVRAAQAGNDQPEPVELVSGLPVGAEILHNPDGTRTLFWVPVVADIGELTISFVQLDGFDASLISEHRLQIEILEAQSTSPRLNPSPKLEIKTSAARTSGAIQHLVSGRPFEMVASAVDEGSEEPRINVQGLPANAEVETLAPSSQRVRWVPAKSLQGYQHVKIYAVDAAEPFQYSSRDINMLVEQESINALSSGRWLEVDYAGDEGRPAQSPADDENSRLGSLSQD